MKTIIAREVTCLRARTAGPSAGMPAGFRGNVVRNSGSLTREPGLLA
jgi:hypothetical protein